MGISGLLPALKSIQQDKHIKEWSGKTVAVDAYGWLHRGTISCPIELALGKPTTKYVEYAMSRVRMLLHYGVTPYLVFDGDYLPSKAGEELGRATRREASKKLGLELLRQGKKAQAFMELQKAIDVTPQMARHLIDTLIENSVKYVVAPYEADAQMYYLERKGLVDAIVSEDSDLLVFGCKNLITKLNQFGEYVHICRDDFSSCKGLSFAGWTDVQFRRMAILSGCDYLENIPRLGLKTAHRLVRKHSVIEKIIKALQFDGQFTIPPNYIMAFRQAELTFLHQRVYCPILQRLIMCTDPETPLNDEELIFIGPEIEEALAQGVARGELDPMTKQPLIPGENTATSKLRFGGPTKQVPVAFPVALPVKPSKDIMSFFKPTPSMQQQKLRTVSATSSADHTVPPIVKRRSSLNFDEDKFSKRPRVPEKLHPTSIPPISIREGPRVPEKLHPTSIPPISIREGASKYFQIPPKKQNKGDNPNSHKGVSYAPSLLRGASGKENLALAKPTVSARALTTGRDVEVGTTKGQAQLDRYVGEAKEKKGREREKENQDSARIVANGWRERYAQKPQTSATLLATLVGKQCRSSVSMMTTPLQRIAANAVQGAKHFEKPKAMPRRQRVSQTPVRQSEATRRGLEEGVDQFLYSPS